MDDLKTAFQMPLLRRTWTAFFALAAVLGAAAEPLPFAAQGFEAPGRVGVELAAVGAEAWDFSSARCASP